MRCGVEVTHVTVLFQDFPELLAIYPKERTNAAIKMSLIILALHAVQS